MSSEGGGEQTSEEEVNADASDTETSEPDTSSEDKVYIYTIPVEVEGNTITAVYDPTRGGREYLSYYSPSKYVFITDKASPHLHREQVNVQVEEVTRGEVEASDNIRRDFA